MIIADFHWLLGNKQKARDCSSIKWGALWGSTALLAVINWLFITLQEIKQWPRKGCTFNLNSWREREREEGVLRTNKVTPRFRRWRVRCRRMKEREKKTPFVLSFVFTPFCFFPSHLHRCHQCWPAFVLFELMTQMNQMKCSDLTAEVTIHYSLSGLHDGEKKQHRDDKFAEKSFNTCCVHSCCTHLKVPY